MNTPRRNYHLERLTNLTFAFLNAAQTSSGELTLDYIRTHITGYTKDTHGTPDPPKPPTNSSTAT